MQVLGFFIFITIFLSICLAGNFYIVFRFLSFWNAKLTGGIWILITILSASYVASSILDHYLPSFLSRMLLRLSGLWLGIGFLCIVCLAVHDLLRLIIPFPTALSRWFVLSIIVLLTVYSLLNAFRLEVRNIEIPAPVDKTILHVSDVHLGSVSKKHLKKIVEKTNQLHPDLILFTGDLIDPHSGASSDALSPLNALQVPAYWTSGNHERYAGLNQVMKQIGQIPLTALRNQGVSFQNLQLVGIDDSDDPSQVETQLQHMNLDPNLYTILMYHRPVGLEAAEAAGIHLMLSGHTHNGQIFPFNWIVRFHFPRIKGLFKYKNCYLYVSTGAGTWGPPMRLGSQNQITLIQLQQTK